MSRPACGSRSTSGIRTPTITSPSATPRHISARGDCRDLATAIGRLESAGWSPPPHSKIMVERIRPTPEEPVEQWRTYFVGDEVLLDGDSIADAQPSHDPNTGRPNVLLEFDAAGGQRFGEITARTVGRKLATIIGGEVRSAPIINTPIRGGRAVISMGGVDVASQEREAAATAAALRVGALPRGGKIEDRRWIAPPDISGVLLLARLVIGLLGGALVGAAVGLAVRVTRPVWPPVPRRRAGTGAGRRLAVTLLAPVALFALGQVTLPGVNDVSAGFLVRRGFSVLPVGSSMSVIQLAVGPIINAFLVVELAMLVVPRWRRLRRKPEARLRSGRYVAVLGIVFALVQAHLVVGYLSSIAATMPEVFTPGIATHVTAALSLTSGTLVLVIVAGLIRQHGLGNGYGALIASAWCLPVLDIALDRAVFHPSASGALGMVTLLAIACATVALLRMRITDEGEAPMRLPASGIAPLTSAASLIALWATVGIGGRIWSRLAGVAGGAGLAAGRTSLVASLVLLVALVPVWSFAFSRPAIVAGFAPRAELAPPSRAAWRRAAVLSLVILLVISAASLIAAHSDLAAGALGDAVSVMTLTAVLLDIRDDLRTRRGSMIAVWPLHQAQHAELARRALARAGIDCELSASHLRTLLAFFGPYAPIDVVVPAESAAAARRTIAGLFDTSPVDAFD